MCLCNNIQPKLKKLWKPHHKTFIFDRFSWFYQVFKVCTIWAEEWILVQKHNKVMILVPFRFFWHPWHPWGRIHIYLNKDTYCSIRLCVKVTFENLTKSRYLWFKICHTHVWPCLRRATFTHTKGHKNPINESRTVQSKKISCRDNNSMFLSIIYVVEQSTYS